MNLACRMVERNTNYSITKLPALNMSNFFFTSPSSCDGGYEKDVLKHEDINNNRLLARQNDSLNGKLPRHSNIEEFPISNDSFEIPEIHITSNDNLLDLPTVDETGNNKIPVLESYPCNICLDSPDNDNNRSSGKSSLDESTMQRTQSEQFIFDHYANDTKHTKSWKKFKPVFRNVSRSIESLDVVEPESPTKHKSPMSGKRRFHRGASEPHIEPLILRNELGHAKSLINIRSPFLGRKHMTKINPEDEKRKMHSEMLNCIRNDDCKGFRSLLKKRLVDVNIVTKDGSLIHDASYRGCTKCMKALLKGGCYVNLCDDLGWTALHAAVLSKSLDAIKLLLDNYALPNQLNYDGLSPCHLAVITGDLYIVHELVKAGGDPLVKNTSITPFQLAIDLKQTIILDYFLHMPSFLVDI